MQECVRQPVLPAAADARRARGLVVVHEDRHADGLLLDASCGDNLVLGQRYPRDEEQEIVARSVKEGGAPLGNHLSVVPEADARAALEAAWDEGIRYFDTAPQYGFGLSEHRFGAGVPTGHDPVQVLADDRVVGAFDKFGEYLARSAAGPVEHLRIAFEPAGDGRDGGNEDGAGGASDAQPVQQLELEQAAAEGDAYDVLRGVMEKLQGRPRPQRRSVRRTTARW